MNENETPLDRRAKIEAKRQEILNTTTKEQRVKEMMEFLEQLFAIGKGRSLTEDEVEAHTRLLDKRSTVYEKLYDLGD